MIEQGQELDMEATGERSSNRLPRGWAWTTLGQIHVDKGSSIVPSKQPEATFELYSVPSYDTRQPEIISGRQIGSGKRTVEQDTVLLCKINPRINRTWVVGSHSAWPKIASTEWIAFSKVEGILPKYLANYMKIDAFRDFLAQNASGVGGSLMRVKASTFATYPFPLAPVEEQERIVTAIEQQFSRIDAGIAALKQVRAKLKRYRAAVLKAAVEGTLTEAWRAQHPDIEPASDLLGRILDERRNAWEQAELTRFAKSGKTPPKGWQGKYREPEAPDTTNLPAMPEGWRWAAMDQVTRIQGGIQKQPSRTPKNNAFPYLRVANVLRGQLDLYEVHEIELFRDELETLRLKAGDLLIVEGNGSRTEIGRSALWNGQIDDCVHQNHIIRARPMCIESEYLDYYWNSPAGNARVMNVAASTSGLYTLSVSKIAKLPVPIPPLAEQEQIVAEVERRLSVVAETEAQVAAELRRAERLRQGILALAFAGKLVPQDPADEPASALLERIRAEKTGGRTRTQKGVQLCLAMHAQGSAG